MARLLHHKKRQAMRYYNSKTIKGKTFEEVRKSVEGALKDAGFGILTEIDLQKTMKAKLDKDYLPHVILGACSPVYADKVLSIDPSVSTMLPCNVTIREIEKDKHEVSTINPLFAMEGVGNAELRVPAAEIQDKLQGMLDKL